MVQCAQPCYYQEINQKELEGELDEGFLSEVNAQLRKVSILIALYFVAKT